MNENRFLVHSEKRFLELAALLAVLTMALLAVVTPASAEQYNILYSFGGVPQDGQFPRASSIFDTAGNLYGTTIYGGPSAFGNGVQAHARTSGGWSEEVLYNFDPRGEDGYSPFGSLIFDARGNLYGAACCGSIGGGGTVFELMPKTAGRWTEKVLHSFNTGPDSGYDLYSGVISDSSGNLYGAASRGGTLGYGAIYELTRTDAGTWPAKALHSFGGGTDGRYPFSAMIFDAAGNLYGTTYQGGTGACLDNSGILVGCGAVFELTPEAGGGWSGKLLHSFNNDGTEGINPYGGLTFDARGNLYGTTYFGGPDNLGTVFELMPQPSGLWTGKTLYSFNDNGMDGANPTANLIFDGIGNLYGTTDLGGPYGYGTVFELSPLAGGGWTELQLHSFGNGTDGSQPLGGMVFDAAGNLYGATDTGGAYGYGTVYEITP